MYESLNTLKSVMNKKVVFIKTEVSLFIEIYNLIKV